MADEDKKRAAHRALVGRVLNGKGRASAERRARAFDNEGLSPPLDALIDKVADFDERATGAAASGESVEESAHVHHFRPLISSAI
ncbi:hypothetical protein AB0L00_28190 [Actinoallomurus sp. NPDC052308]|uniref:hypothetical protein n=1 Tax=Actinoallomurus sp. NPDC052308 TaxID=3155530 RepID=UPI003442CD24